MVYILAEPLGLQDCVASSDIIELLNVAILMVLYDPMWL
jgi:hypothetical protein